MIELQPPYHSAYQETIESLSPSAFSLELSADDGSSNGMIEFYFDEEEHYWEIDMIVANPKGSGLGTHLLRAFTSRIGHQQPVHTVIVEEDTNKALQNLGYLDYHHLKDGAIEVRGDEITHKLKLLRVFRSGGLLIDKLLISLRPSEEDRGALVPIVEFFGATL